MAQIIYALIILDFSRYIIISSVNNESIFFLVLYLYFFFSYFTMLTETSSIIFNGNSGENSCLLLNFLGDILNISELSIKFLEDFLFGFLFVFRCNLTDEESSLLFPICWVLIMNKIYQFFMHVLIFRLVLFFYCSSMYISRTFSSSLQNISTH